MSLPVGLSRVFLISVGAFVAVFLFVKTSSLMLMIGVFCSVVLAVICLYNETKEYVSGTNRAVLVTGCDTGFGFELVHQLDQKGLHVFAGCLFKNGEGAKKLQENCSERVHVVQLDVTNDQQIKDALEYVKKNLPKLGLWAVVNNAGLNFLGELELTTMEQYKRVIDINLTGVIRITKTFLPLVIQSKGRVINVTSVKGLISSVFVAAYASTKFGLEGFSDTLRLEMRKWGVKVIIVEPGCFGSGTKAVDADRMAKDFEAMWDDMDEERRNRYGKQYVDNFNNLITSSDRVSSYDTHLVTSAMVDAILNSEPKSRYLIGGGNQFIDPNIYYIILSWFLPTVVVDHFLYRWAGSKFPLPKALQKQ